MLLLVLVAALIAFAAPAAFAGDGSIEGTVTAAPAGLVGLNDISVYAFALAAAPTAPPALSEAVEWGVTDTAGHYSFEIDPSSVLPPGYAYYVWFQDRWSPANQWIGQWYQGSSPWDDTATGGSPVTVLDSQAAQNIDDSLTRASHILGNVGVANIGVYVHGVNIGDDPTDLAAWVQAIEAGDVTPDALTAPGGSFDIGQLNPTEGLGFDHYVVYFSDPSKNYAPQFYDGVDPWEWDAPTPVTMGFGLDAVLSDDLKLAPAGTIQGTVYSWMRQPLEGIQVDAHSTVDWLLATPFDVIYGSDTTDYFGEYSIEGLAAGTYIVSFTDPYAYYQNEWWSSKEFALDQYVPMTLDANPITVAGGVVHGNVDATLGLIPWISSYNPYWAVTNNPDPQRPPTVFTIDGLGLNMLNADPGWWAWSDNTPDVYVWWDHAAPTPDDYVYAFDVDVTKDGTSLTAKFDFVENPWPAGMYPMYVRGYDQFDEYTNLFVGYVQLIGYTTPTPPPVPTVTPAAPPATPPAPPAPVTPPVVTPVVPVTPVAGAITTTATSATVKRGHVASLKYQVNEAVLGGTANVTIQIKKSGQVVKTFKVANAAMNTQLVKNFTCKLAKGKYMFYVSAATATAASTNTASSTLTVK